jgi:phage minor structural protein
VVIKLIFVLNQKEDLVGVLNNATPFSCPYFDDKHVENLETGVHSYEFSVPASHETAGAIEPEGFVIITDLDKKQQMFKVKEIVEVGNASGYIKTVFCEHIAISELLVDVVRPITLNSTTLDNALDVVLDGTAWVKGEIDYTESQDIVFDKHVTVLEALKTLMEKFVMEVQFEIVFKNGLIQKRLIHLQAQRGNVTNKPFLYGKDLVEVKRTYNSDEVITALIGVGKGDAEGNPVTFTNYGFSSGSYTTDIGEDYVTNEDLLQRWGVNGKHKFGVYYSEQTEPLPLFRETFAELGRRSTPSIKYECSVVTLERIIGYDADKVRVGDTVLVKDRTFTPELVISARIIEVTRSYTAPENDAVVLGDYKPVKLSDVRNLKDIQNRIQQKETLWETTAYKVEIHSSSGLMFKAGIYDTVLEAKVYRGAVDVTDETDANRFKWTRTSNDTVSDTLWNDEHAGGTKSITVSNDDVRNRATFNCEVMV